jgi:hypothetical protein
MTDQNRQSAFLNSQVACALIEAASMTAENMIRWHRDEAMAYNDAAFLALIDKYGISHNAALTTLDHLS